MNVLLQQAIGFLRRYPFAVVCTVLILGLSSASYFLWQRQKQLAGGHETVRRNGEDMLLSLTGLTRVTTELAAVKEALDFIDRGLIREGDLAENLGYFYQLETISHAH